MTVFTGFLWPDTLLYQEGQSTSITNNPLVYTPGWALIDINITSATLQSTRNPVSHGFKLGHVFSHTAHLFPSYADDLFNHFLVVPSVLDLGNLLSNQSKTVEVANFYPINMEATGVVNPGGGISIPGLPTFPYTITPYGSLILNIEISATGSPSLKEILELDVAAVGGGSPQALFVPVTGQRVTIFVWQPEQFYVEEMVWVTDIIEAYDGTEQRIKLRQNPRQVLTYECFFTDSSTDTQARLALFNWFAQIFGVPIWWEQTPFTTDGLPGDTVINTDTRYADYREGGLVLVVDPAGYYEAFEIDTLTTTSITVTSQLTNTYLARGSKVMPIRTCYAKTQSEHSVLITGAEKITVQFTTLDNVDLSSTAGLTTYQGLVVLEGINYVDGQLSESMQRTGVVIIDNISGTLYQRSSNDRSRPFSVKTWFTNYASEIWPLRQMFHAFSGSQKTFWLPTNRNDMKLVASIGGGSPTFQIEYVGYSSYGVDVNGVSMRPFGDLRFTLADGTLIYRQIIGATSSGNTETVTVDSPVFGSTLTIAQVARIEFLQLMRIADDKVRLIHDHPGRAQISINTVGVKS